MKIHHCVCISAIVSIPLHASPLSAVYRNLSNESQFIPFDYDNDGDLDLIASSPTHTWKPSSTAIYYNNGNQVFDGPYVAAYHGDNGSTMMLGKRSMNEQPGIYRLKIKRSTQNTGRFNFAKYEYHSKTQISTPGFTPLLPAQIEPVHGSDLDNDGFIDIILYNQTDKSLSISWGNHKGTSTLAQSSETVTLDDNIQIIDFDNNGLTDIITEHDKVSPGSLRISLQTSPARFAAPQALEFTNNSPVVDNNWLFADLNGDRLPDIYTVADKTFTYSLQTPSGFTPASTITHEHDLNTIIGIQPIIDQDSRIIYLYQNESSPLAIHTVPFNAPSEITKQEIEPSLMGSESIPRTEPPSTQLLSDINRDGNLDILLSLPIIDPWAPYSQNGSPETLRRLCLGMGQTDGSYLFNWQGNSPISNFVKAKGIFNGDETPDFIMGTLQDKQLVLISYSAEQGWVRERTLNELLPESYQQQGIAIYSISAADLNMDGATDLHITLSKPTSSYQQPSPGGLSGTSPLDPALDYHRLVALNDGMGNFTYTSSAPHEFNNHDYRSRILTYADWDHDGDLDAFTSDIGWHENRNGIFSEALHFLLSPGVSTDPLGNPITVSGEITVSDIDGDGALDLAVPITGISKLDLGTGGVGLNRPPTQITILFGNGYGGISEIKHYPVSLLTSDALGNPIILNSTFFDLNQDGKLDLIYDEIVIDALGNPMGVDHVIYNSPDGRFQNLTALNYSNAFYGQIIGDYNGDHQLDLIGLEGYTTPTHYGPLKSPIYNIFSSYNADDITDIFDIDLDHDDDFFFIPKNSKGGLYCLRNPIVDSKNPIIRYALDAGLMATQTAPEADPEGDGINNFTEYMFGGNPASNDSPSILPQLGFSRQLDQPHLMANFAARKKLPAGLQYRIQISHDLHTWIDYPLESSSPTSINSEWQQFNLSIDPTTLIPDTGNAFIQWKVE